jgi:hypothetical protein
MDTRSTLRNIAGLMSEHGENPEYDRACVEIACDLLGMAHDDRDAVEALLRRVKEAQ